MCHARTKLQREPYQVYVRLVERSFDRCVLKTAPNMLIQMQHVEEMVGQREN
jgi:hypothetical protein